MLASTCVTVVEYIARTGPFYVALTGPFYVAFWRITTQPIKLQRFEKLCYAVIAHIAFHVYLATYLLLFYSNFQRFISNGWCSKQSKRITVLSKGKAFNFYEPIVSFGMSIFKINYYTVRKTPIFRRVDLILIVKPDIIIIVMNTGKKISFLLIKYKSLKNDAF